MNRARSLACWNLFSTILFPGSIDYFRWLIYENKGFYRPMKHGSVYIPNLSFIDRYFWTG